MKDISVTRQEAKALETASMICETLPLYIEKREDKRILNFLILSLIDALDIIEFEENGEPFFSVFKNSPPDIKFASKKAVMQTAKEYSLTERELQVIAYLANGRNTTYIAEALSISKATAKAHKYSIYKKLGIHTADELKAVVDSFDTP